MVIDRVNATRCLAKAIAFKQVGDDQQAAIWAARLVYELAASEILKPAYQAGEIGRAEG